MWVEDNGVGVLPEKIDAIIQNLQVYPPAQGYRHFGIYNAHLRIKNTFGNDYGISIESAIGGYTRVNITMPSKEEGC